MTDNGSGRRPVLSLGGGGVRGVIAIAFLERIETILGERAPGFRLANRFDPIGGTSTGAIIATALALGLKSSEIRNLYFRLAPRVFTRSRLRVRLIQSVFNASALEEEIAAIVGDRRIETPDPRSRWRQALATMPNPPLPWGPRVAEVAGLRRCACEPQPSL